MFTLRAIAHMINLNPNRSLAFTFETNTRKNIKGNKTFSKQSEQLRDFQTSRFLNWWESVYVYIRGSDFIQQQKEISSSSNLIKDIKLWLSSRSISSVLKMMAKQQQKLQLKTWPLNYAKNIINDSWSLYIKLWLRLCSFISYRSRLFLVTSHSFSVSINHGIQRRQQTYVTNLQSSVTPVTRWI